jgi:flagellar hook assembly protein FlgD
VSIRVYDIRGTYVVSLVQKEHATGVYSVEWDGRDADGTVVGSGMYFARIEHNGAMRSKKMVLLK